jgi:hypothetical protein
MDPRQREIAQDARLVIVMPPLLGICGGHVDAGAQLVLSLG